jgi:hypothetical protein
MIKLFNWRTNKYKDRRTFRKELMKYFRNKMIYSTQKSS